VAPEEAPHRHGLQLLSTLGPGDWTSSFKPVWAPLPFFHTNLIAGYVVDEDVLTLMAMLSPNAAELPSLARSGETAPFHTYSEEFDDAPCWKSEAVAGFISYQRSWDPAPPNTACAVHS